MATRLFLRSVLDGRIYGTSNNDANLRGTASPWSARILATTAGSSLATTDSTSTVAGATVGVEVNDSGSPAAWYSPPLDAAVTISGSITWNIWANETNASANVAINGRIDKVDGATGAITAIDTTARIIEVSSATRTVNNFAKTPAAGVACKRGDRLRVRIFGDDAGTMGTGFTFAISLGGPTAAADGDTWLQLTENLTFAAEPAGTQVFPTATASPVATAATDLEAWTSRGAGVATAVTNTAAGWTAPIQATGTAGGTVVEWYTRPLTAFTLGGAVRINVRALESLGSANASVRADVAVVANDGSSPVAWATGGVSTELLTTESAQSFLIAGDNVAVSANQRLRIRFYVDDLTDAQLGASQTVTLFYAGASGATGDTFLTFTQTLTESITYVPRNPGVNFQNPGVL